MNLIAFSIVLLNSLIAIFVYSIFKSIKQWSIQAFKKIFIPNIICLHIYLSYQSFFVVYSSFNCISLFGLPNQMLYYDHSIQCWTEEHSKWTFGLALPLLIVWIILLPIFLFIKIFLNLNLVRQRNEEFLNTFGILTKGYNDNSFYWEFLIYFNKNGGIMLNTFLARMTQGFCGLFLIIYYIIASLHDRWQAPYSSYYNYFISKILNLSK